MARKSMGRRSFGKKFGKARRKSRAINSSSFILRGGIRL